MASDYSEENVATLGEVSTRNNTALDIDYTTRRWDNSMNFQGKLKKDDFLDVTLAYLNYDRFDISYRFDPETNTSVLIENNPNANANYFNTFFAKGQYAQSSPSRNFNYVVGFEYTSDVGKGNRILETRQRLGIHHFSAV